MPFATNVFINCPFDEQYLEILRPILFCVIDIGFEPRIALEHLDSGSPRIEKIIRLIRESKYGIHDLSRMRADRRGQYFRLNMPFELGLDVGSRVFGRGSLADKKCLILEAERYRYQAAISDLSNSDIGVHNNQAREALDVVRNWLVCQASLTMPGPEAMWGRFIDFMAANYDILKGRGYSDRDIERLPVSELIPNMKRWIAANPHHT
jgi:hypothetical protein